ncbi:MAG TPA: hypothetical protein VG125_02820 [Pirellulales bacterium]|jgi:hypothetical protein|nr:hypothetical protein [Pirellulales bacterium]
MNRNAIDDDSLPGGENIRQGLPGPDWSRDELYARAVWEYRRIDRGETYSPRYWFLGMFLLAVPKEFELGAWKQWCLRRDLLNRTRCERSMLIARAFNSADEVEHIPVLEAVALAAQRLGLQPRQSAADAKLRRRLTSIGKTLQSCLDEFPAVRSADGLGWRIAGAMQTLRSLDQERIALEERLAQVLPFPPGEGRGEGARAQREIST